MNSRGQTYTHTKHIHALILCCTATAACNRPLLQVVFLRQTASLMAAKMRREQLSPSSAFIVVKRTKTQSSSAQEHGYSCLFRFKGIDPQHH